MEAKLNERKLVMEAIDGHLLNIGNLYRRAVELGAEIGRELYGSTVTLPEALKEPKFTATLAEAFNAALAGRLGDKNRPLSHVTGPLGEIFDTSSLADRETTAQTPLKGDHR